MKNYIAKLSIGLAFATSVAACAGDRFDGQSETEMFETVRSFMCEQVNRCPVLWDDDNPPASVSESECKAGFDDPASYQETIDDATRESLNTCLDAIEDVECAELNERMPADCESVKQYLDLK